LQNHSVAVRYPRGAGAGTVCGADLTPLPFGKGEIRRASSSQKIAILCFGTMLYPALQIAESLDATVVNMRWAKPLDTALLQMVVQSHESLVTLEEGCVMGGAGSAVLEALAAMGMAKPVLQLGLPDVFIEHGDPVKLLAMQGLDAAGIQASIRARFVV
jgi:1-deoxy-D-xylulose-5-phosphate synthase